MVPDKRDTSAFTLLMITSNIESCNPSNYLPSTKIEYSRLKRGRHVVATFQPIMPLCVKSLSVSRQKQLHDVCSVNVTRLRLREAPQRAGGSKGWCSYGGSEVRPIAYLYSGISTSLAFRQHLASFAFASLPRCTRSTIYHCHYLNNQSIRTCLHDLLVASAQQ